MLSARKRTKILVQTLLLGHSSPNNNVALSWSLSVQFKIVVWQTAVDCGKVICTPVESLVKAALS